MFFMKKGSLSRQRRFEKKLLFSFVALLLIFISTFLVGRKDIRWTVYLVVRQNMFYVYEGFMSVVSSPFEWTGGQLSSFQDILFVHDQNRELKEEVSVLKSYHLQAEMLRDKLVALEKQVKFVQSLPPSTKMARVYFDAFSPFVRSFFIEAGKKDGIKKLSPVLANGYLLGQIVDVYETKSRVLLITDSNARIPVMTSQTRRRFFLSGDNMNGAVLIYPEDKTDVEVGELVVSSGFQGVFPADFLIGKIESVSKDIHVKPFFKMSEIEWVQIIDIEEMP